MAFPPSLSLTTVVAQYTDFISDDTGWRYLGGTLALTCDYTLRVPADNTFIGPFTLHAAFDPDTGTATIENVPVSDDANLSAPFDYQVTLDLVGKPRHSFRTAIETADGNPVQLADKAGTVTPVQGAAYALLNGANTFTGANEFTQPVTIPEEPDQPDHATSMAYVLERLDELNDLVMHLAGNETATGIKTFRQLHVTMADLLNIGFVLDQPNTVTNIDDADGFQMKYAGEPRIWGNEKISLRLRRSGNEIPLRVYLDPLDGTTPTAWALEFIGMGAAGTVARMGPNGSFYDQLNDRTAWTNINVDSLTVPNKFTAHTQDGNGGTPQYRVVNNGARTEFRGAIDTVNDATNNAQIWSDLANVTFIGMGGSVDPAPARIRQFAAGFDGAGAQRIRINSNGSGQAVGTVAATSRIYLDGCYIDRD